MITDSLVEKIANALKSKDQVRLSTLRMLSSALNYERIEKGRSLSEEEEIAVVRKEAKKRVEAMDAYKKASRIDLFEKEQKELSVLKEFFPPEISDEDLDRQIQKELVNFPKADMSQMGQIMGVLVPKLKSRARPERIAERLKKLLQK